MPKGEKEFCHKGQKDYRITLRCAEFQRFVPRAGGVKKQNQHWVRIITRTSRTHKNRRKSENVRPPPTL